MLFVIKLQYSIAVDAKNAQEAHAKARSMIASVPDMVISRVEEPTAKTDKE